MEPRGQQAPYPGLTQIPGRTNAPARACFIVGIASLVALIVPLGWFIAPVLGVAALALGTVALTGRERLLEGTERAITGMVLGGISLVSASVLLWLFHHLIAQVLHSINAG